MQFFIEGWWHHKNRNGIELMIKEGIKVDFDHYDTSKKYDWIISLSDFKSYQNHDGGVIYGPHIELNNILEKVPYLDGKSYINLLSNWLVDLTNSIIESDKYLSLPFAVDVDKFIPNEKNEKPIIYYKDVDISWFDKVTKKLGSNFTIFDYSKGYNEIHFLEAISKAPYAIWIGRHESQGFAFQETMSCNTPIFVIDVNSLRDEVVNNKRNWVNFHTDNPLIATAASYFDESCGLITNINDWENDYEVFIKNLNHYSPREFVVNKLSAKSCVDLWIDKLSKLR